MVAIGIWGYKQAEPSYELFELALFETSIARAIPEVFDLTSSTKRAKSLETNRATTYSSSAHLLNEFKTRALLIQ